jgi:RHS repeat-associated protein
MIGVAELSEDQTQRTLGDKQYEISNHLGNVLSVVSDVKLPVVDGGLIVSYRAVVVSSTDYSPFGVGLEGRSYSLEEYRYGFNGKEKDDEGMGGGNQTYDYGFRIYNPSLGKFLSVDPLTSKYVFYTPYQFAGNKPIVAIDIDGLEDMWVHSWINADGSTGSVIKYCTDSDFQGFKEQMAATLGIPLEMIPKTGCLMTNQTYSEDGLSFTVQTDYMPTVVIDGRDIWDKAEQAICETLSDATSYLNSLGSAENGYELDGEEGLKTFSKSIDKAGTALTFTPLAQLGAGLKLTSDVIDTALDFKNRPAGDAALNTLPRAVGMILGGFIGNFLKINKTEDKLFNEGARSFIQGTYEMAGDQVEEAVEQQIDKNAAEREKKAAEEKKQSKNE